MIACSVIVPAFNSEATLASCLRSITQQKCNGDIEIIVVDDFSKDSTPDVARQWGAKLIQNEKNIGPGGSRNRGVAKATGSIIAFLDADDIANPTWLQTVIELLKDGVAGIGCSHELLNPGILSTLTWLDQMMRHQRLGGTTEHVGASGSVWFKHFLISSAGFSENMRCAEDANLVEKAVATGLIVIFTPERLIKVSHKMDLLSFIRSQILKVAYLVYLKMNDIINRNSAGHPSNKKYANTNDLLNGLVPYLFLSLACLDPKFRVIATVLGVIAILVLNIRYTIYVMKNCQITWVKLLVIPYEILRSFTWSAGLLVGVLLMLRSIHQTIKIKMFCRKLVHLER